jgi:hypothetical protein
VPPQVGTVELFIIREKSLMSVSYTLKMDNPRFRDTIIVATKSSFSANYEFTLGKEGLENIAKLKRSNN